jgi:phospholipid/cholesterol/gamma-HCH transport system substrate-binding protein
MSNEVKIGILAIVAVGLSLWGYKFIMGKNALTSSNLYYVDYNTVEGLQKATPVRISGFQVGVVSDIFMKPDDPSRRVTVVLDLNKDIRIPKDTRATIVATSIMGAKAIDLFYENPCSGEECAPSGSHLQGATLGLLGSMLTEDQAKEYVRIVKEGLNEVLDTLNKEFLDENSNSPVALTLRDMRYTMSNLRSSTSQLDATLQRSTRDIEGTFKNLNSVTNTLAANNETIKSILANADNLTTDLAQADLQNTIESIKATVGSLNQTLGSTNTAVQGVNSAISRINAGQGSLGKLLQDEQLYLDLKAMSSNVDTLVNDLQERPYRYIPFKSRKRVLRFDKKDAEKAREEAAQLPKDQVSKGSN